MPNHILRQYLSNVGVFPGKTSRRFDMLKLIEGLKVVPIHEELLRVGPDRDGGYLVPDVLDGIDYCFSPGVADCSEFELQLAKRGIKVFMADKSVQSPSDVHENFNFIEFYISSINSPVEQLITLDAWYEQKLNTIPSATSPEAILQMDVEGDEYQVLHSISNVLLSRFRVIIIEFHKLYPDKWKEIGSLMTKQRSGPQVRKRFDQAKSPKSRAASPELKKYALGYEKASGRKFKKWTFEEEDRFIEAYKETPKQWAIMSKKFPGRSGKGLVMKWRNASTKKKKNPSAFEKFAREESQKAKDIGK